MKPKTTTPWKSRLFHWLTILAILAGMLSPLGMTPAYAAGAPVLLSPADNTITTVSSYPPMAVPEFKWQAVPGALKYHIQIATNEGFNENLQDYTTTNTTFNPTFAGSFADREYFWHVRVVEPTPESAFSPGWRFVVDWATINNRPTLLAPLAGATLAFYGQDTFSWTPITGASSYRLEIATTADGFSAPVYRSDLIVATTHQPTLKLSDGNYYWQVVPYSQADFGGEASEVRSFTVDYSFTPQLLEPAHLADLDFTPTFRWTAVRGAEFYTLQYSTDETFPDSNLTKRIDTRNTTYTPYDLLANDEDYFWRVKAYSNKSDSNWSEVREFRKWWDLAPQLLTPTNNFQNSYLPFFSWTPVPGASRYRFFMARNEGFNVDLYTFETSNVFHTPRDYRGQIYWKVVPLDFHGNEGAPSAVWRFNWSTLAPQLIAPLHYYTSTVITMMEPHEDRAVALPVFQWQRVVDHNPLGPGNILPTAYKLQVSTDSSFWSVDWEIETENLSVAPTADHPFSNLSYGTDYFWRVIPLYGSFEDLDNISDIWKVRFNPAKNLPATPSSQAPVLLRPEHGWESVEMVPLFEWKPVQGADSYEVEISTVADFAAGYQVDSATVPYPAYTPLQAFGQRNLNQLDFGVYYWRVRGLSGSTPLSGGWSETRRFQVAAQSQWTAARALGNLENRRLLIGSDAVGNDQADPNYELNNLYASQAKDYWYIGFEAQAEPANMVYGLYIDLDHKDDSGGATDPRGYDITTSSGQRPEYAVYVYQENREFTPEKVIIYKWNNTLSPPAWDPPKVLADLGGDVYPTNLRGVAYTGIGSAWVVGDHGNILRYEYGDWRAVDSPTYYQLNSVDAVSNDFAWAVGNNGIILQWSDSQWKRLSYTPTSNPINSVRFSSTSDGWMAGDGGFIQRWNGSNWNNYGLPSSYQYANLDAVHVIPSTVTPGKMIGFAVGDQGRIFEFIDNNWSYVNHGLTTQELKSVYVLDDTHAWAAGAGGVILFWNGSIWSTQASGTSNTLYSLAMLSTTNGMAVGYNGVIRRWDGTNWNADTSGTTRTLYSVDGLAPAEYLAVGQRGTNLVYSGGAWNKINTPMDDYVEIEFEQTSIGMEEKTGSASIVLFSLSATPNSKPIDTVPSDPQASSSGLLRFFANVSERMNVRTPSDSVVRGAASLDPTTYPALQPTFWDFPIHAPYAGMMVEIYSDPGFNTKVLEMEQRCNSEYCSQPIHDWERDLKNTTYYWRARPEYTTQYYYRGAWSQGISFVRQGFLPQNLSESVSFATPTFSWSMVEGVEEYIVQIDNDSNIGTPFFYEITRQNSITPLFALGPGTYYWRVQARRWGGITSDWTPTRSFTISLPKPTGLTHYPSGVPNRAPTLCWTPLVANDNLGSPVFAAYRYRLQIAREANFNSQTIMDQIDTEQACWTPLNGYVDGQFFWRVAVIDGSYNLGEFSTPATFTKQYPIPTLVSPLSGSTSGTPTFMWQAVHGAYKYRWEANTSPDFGNTTRIDQIDTFNIRFTPFTNYPTDRLIYWRVAIIDKNNNLGPFNGATVIITTGYRVFLPLTRR